MKDIEIKQAPTEATPERYNPNFREGRNDEPQPASLVDPMTEAMAYNKPSIFAVKQDTIRRALAIIPKGTTIIVSWGQVEQWSFGQNIADKGQFSLRNANGVSWVLSADSVRLVYAGFPFHTDSILIRVS